MFTRARSPYTINTGQFIASFSFYFAFQQIHLQNVISRSAFFPLVGKRHETHIRVRTNIYQNTNSLRSRTNTNVDVFVHCKFCCLIHIFVDIYISVLLVFFTLLYGGFNLWVRHVLVVSRPFNILAGINTHVPNSTTRKPLVRYNSP